jgi:hypothetical protein
MPKRGFGCAFGGHSEQLTMIGKRGGEGHRLHFIWKNIRREMTKISSRSTDSRRTISYKERERDMDRRVGGERLR